jgi:hypothetical protein
MARDLELASFRGDDHPGLVGAALACRVCLSSNVEWSLDVDDVGGEVRCHCLACGHRRAVSLNSDQTLRLALHTPERPLEVAAPLVLGEPIG